MKIEQFIDTVKLVWSNFPFLWGYYVDSMSYKSTLLQMERELQSSVVDIPTLRDLVGYSLHNRRILTKEEAIRWGYFKNG